MRRARLLRWLGAPALVIAVAPGCGAARSGGKGLSRPVAADAFVVAGIDGRLREVRAGRPHAAPIATLTGRRYGILQVDLSPDRRVAYAVVVNAGCHASIVRVDVAAGSVQRIAAGTALALSPDGSKLAIVRETPKDDVCAHDGGYDAPRIVIRDVATGNERVFEPPVGAGVAGDVVVNWSPDDRTLVFDGDRGARLLDTSDVAKARETRLVIEPRARLRPASAPAKGSGIAPPPPPAEQLYPLHSPVFIDADTVVGLADCCIGLQHLVAETLASAAERPFVEIEAPTESIRLRRGSRQVVFVTALRRAWLSDGGAPTLVRTGVTAIAG